MAVWVTGQGAITCSGSSIDALWQAARHGTSGLKDGLGYIPDQAFIEGRAQLADNPLFAKVTLPPNRAKELALLTLEQAVRRAGWTELRPTDGFILATTTGQIPQWDKALTSYLLGTLAKLEFVEAVQHQPLGDLLDSVCSRIGFSGRQLLVTSACAASTQALAIAAMWLEQGLVDRCIVGGAEVLCDLTIQGFSSLQLLSRKASQPFDLHRSGINLSEGAGFLCLESEPSDRSLACLSGFGLSSDGYHMTAPQPEGHGCRKAMAAALASAALACADIDWIHAHGTGSTHNDSAEAAAIRSLFSNDPPWVSSSKWVHGHALGASGVIESILCIEALRHQIVLKTHGLEQPDPALHLRHPPTNVPTKIQHILKNTLGFGGTNAALVWSAI